MVRDLKSGREVDVTRDLDRPVLSFTWADDGGTIIATIDDQGTESVVVGPWSPPRR